MIAVLRIWRAASRAARASPRAPPGDRSRGVRRRNSFRRLYIRRSDNHALAAPAALRDGRDPGSSGISRRRRAGGARGIDLPAAVTMIYRAILFDLDDTLYDLRSYWRGRLHHALDDVLARYPHFDRNELVRLAIAQKVYIDKLPAFLREQGVDDETLIAVAHNM